MKTKLREIMTIGWIKNHLVKIMISLVPIITIIALQNFAITITPQIMSSLGSNVTELELLYLASVFSVSLCGILFYAVIALCLVVLYLIWRK